MIKSAMAARRLTTLKELGLSDYAAQAYLALLRSGSAQAREVSRHARVPLSKIYGTLNQLIDKGLATVDHGRPKLYTPMAIAEFAGATSAHHRERAVKLEQAIPHLAELFPIEGAIEVKTRGSVSSLHGRRVIGEKLSAMMRATKTEVLASLSDHAMTRFVLDSGAPEGDAPSGVRPRIVVRAAPEGPSGALRQYAKGREVRVQLATPKQPGSVSVWIFDRSLAILVHYMPDDSNSVEGSDFAMLVDEGAIVRRLHEMLEHEWERAEALDAWSVRPLAPPNARR